MDRITPEIYEGMNEEFVEDGTPVRLVVGTQESIDKWLTWKCPDFHERKLPNGQEFVPVDMVAQMWEDHRRKEMDKEIEMMFGSEYESGIDYDQSI